MNQFVQVPGFHIGTIRIDIKIVLIVVLAVINVIKGAKSVREHWRE